jgi:hypothetical protein
MSDNLKKIGIPTATVALALVLVAPAMLSTGAFAIPPDEVTRDGGLHFVGDPDLTVNKEFDENGRVVSASLTAEGEVAGAGPTATATLSSTAEVEQGCITRGGGEPGGLEDVTVEATGSEEFNTRQGRGAFTVETNEIEPGAGGFDCPSRQQTEVILGVTFTEITLTVESQTGTTTATFADQDP